MGSIASTTGDGGQTTLAGGRRVSKSDMRVEAYGSVDELTAAIGVARSICDAGEIRELARDIQLDLFAIGSALATPADSAKPPVPIPAEMIERLTIEVHRLEGIEGLLADWAVPGEHAAAASFDLARTVCRRAERAVVRCVESGEAVQPTILAYLNRLSDLLWLFGRQLEHDAGITASLRDATGRTGNPWSRAW